MAKRTKKPLVTQEQRRNWLKRYDQGESLQEIARNDKYDARTVRKHVEEAQQEREGKEARSMVLRNALERHYQDLVEYAEMLDSTITGWKVTAPESLRDPRLRDALRQHIPRSPIWKYLERRQRLQEEISQLTQEIAAMLEGVSRQENSVRLDPRLASVLHEGGTMVVPGMIELLRHQVGQWSVGGRGLTVEENFAWEPAEDGLVGLHYGGFGMGKVKKEHVATIREVLRDWEQRVKEWEEVRRLQKSEEELRRIGDSLRDELAVIRLRRIVPGHCRYCPL